MSHTRMIKAAMTLSVIAGVMLLITTHNLVVFFTFFFAPLVAAIFIGLRTEPMNQ